MSGSGSSSIRKDNFGYIVDETGTSAFGGLVNKTGPNYLGEPQISIAQIGAASTDASQEKLAKWLLKTQSDARPITRPSMFVSNMRNASVGATAYEDMGILVINGTYDSSAAADKDCVGLDARGYVMPGNVLGRSWGIFCASNTYDATADGLLQALEVSVGNSGTDQAAVNTTTSKYGIHAVADGTVNSTAALYVGSGVLGAKWHKGVVSSADQLVAIGTDANASFLELRATAGGTKLFIVQPDGQVIATLMDATNNAGAQAAGTPLGGLYFDSTAANVVKIRTV